MAYVNVAEWTPDRVSEWLKGLEDVIVPYIHYFVNNQVDGKRLLQLTPDELPSLHVTKIGHQEIILQGIELLRNIHYQLHQENVQYLALRLSSKARGIYNELRIVTAASRNGGGSAGEDEEGEDDDDDGVVLRREKAKKKQERVSTAVIAGVADVLSSVKGLVSWLNRQPFAGVQQYDCLKNSFVDLSIRLATIAQRDMFAENQATVILQACLTLAQISDKIIQEYSDPLIIQPASLDIATIKKKADDEWGVMLQGSYHGIHQVSGVRNLSPAHQCGKLEEGDELVQVNYQTVVGWSPHKVLAVMQESPVEVILTIKKPPRHSNTVTQIYFKPFRLPSKKRTYSPWGTTVGSSACYDLQSIPNLQLSVSVDKVPIQLKLEPEPTRPKSSTPPPPPPPPPAVAAPVIPTPSPQNLSSLSDMPNTTSGSDSDESDLDDDAFLSDNDLCGSSPISVRLYHPKPRAPVQRRATIPGATTRTTFSINQLLQDVRLSRGALRGFPEGSVPSDPDLRTPSGNDHRIARPHTCIGTEDKDGLNSGIINTVLKEEAPHDDKEEQLKGSVDGEKKILEQDESLECKTEERRVVNVIPLPPRKPTTHSNASGQEQVNPVSHHSIIPDKGAQGKSPLLYGKGQPPSIPPPHMSSAGKATPEVTSRMRRVSDDRPKLDKSHSTPAYDMDGDGLAPVVFPATISERSPSHASPSSSTSTATPKFFNTFDSKSALMPPPVPPQQGSYNARDVSMEPPFKTPTTVSSTVVSNAAGGKNHFTSQVVFPVVVPVSNAAQHTRSTENAARVEAFENGAGPNKHCVNEIVDDKQLHGTFSGDGSSSTRKCSASSASVEKAKIPQIQQTAVPPASQHSSTSAAVVLRETRSSSPSVWRRGLLVTDRGSRRISCRDLGQGDHQGWLYRRRDNKGFLLPHRWERRWFILKKNYLYGYRDREAVRADSLVYLPGFRVCPANDVKSKKFAFKIYHSSGATFYFACDTSEERSRWMSQMGLSAISSLATHHRHQMEQQQQQQQQQQQNQWEEVYYSETDEELEDRTSPSRRSPQSAHSRVSPNRDNVGSLWRGSSASPSRGPQSRGSQLGSLSTGKNTALRFLQPGRDSNQPVPTASFRSYRRVSESSSRSTSTGDLRGATKLDTPTGSPSDERGSRSGVTRKNSLRDRLRQLPASFTLDRRKQSASRATAIQQEQQKQNNRIPQNLEQSGHAYRNPESSQLEPTLRQELEESESNNHPSKDSESIHHPSKDSESTHHHSRPSLTDQSTNDEPSSEEMFTSLNNHRPHYMLPTCASSQHTPLRPSSVDLDTRISPSRVGNGRWFVSPPSSGRCSPSKVEHGSRRGSVGGESPVRSRSPRRGSLDCLTSSHPRALSPPMSPLHTPTRSSHGSTSSLLASEEYREGSPEKLWISSLRSDASKPRPPSGRSSPEKKDGRSRSASGETLMSDRLKRTALYHPPQLRNRGDPMKAAFELALDPTSGTVQILSETKDRSQMNLSLNSTQQVLSPEHYDLRSPGINMRKQQVKEATSQASTARTPSISRPEVPPRTKFLSPSERTLPVSTSLCGSAPVITCRASSLSPSPSDVSFASTKSTSSLPGVLSAFHSRPVTSPSSSSHEDSSVNGSSTGRPVPSLTITTLAEESDSVRTPLKPAMGVSMIGKQRRTPVVMSPRDVFFSSPPASPTVPFSTNLPTAIVSPTLTASSGTPTTFAYPLTMCNQSKVARNQKILPHYPGMEYPPVFEPGSYSLFGSPPDNQSTLYQNPAEIKMNYSGNETDSTYGGSLSNVAMSDSSLDMENGNCSSDMQQQQQQHLDGSNREVKSQRSLSVHSSTGVTLHNFFLMNPSGARSPQNVYVSAPTGSRSHQNLYGTSPGYNSNQNIYVSTPTVRSSSHQNIYVTSPLASTSHQVHGCVTTPAIYSSSQIFQVSSASSGSSPECILSEGSDRHRLVSNFPIIEEKVNEDGPPKTRRRRRRSSPKPQGPPRLLIPAPPESPPSGGGGGDNNSDDDDTSADTSSHTESTI